MAPGVIVLLLLGCGGPPLPSGGPSKPETVATPVEFVVGKTIYDANCGVCHNTSRDGAPRLGFKRAWTRRMKQGVAVMANNAISGVGLMPPRGDNPGLTDDEVRAAVGYMVHRAELEVPARH